MREKDDKHYKKMRDSIESMCNFLEGEIHAIEAHTVAWYRIYGLKTNLYEALDSLKLVENEVLGVKEAFEYLTEKDIRERI